MTQCQHYNITVRHDALTGLRELVSTHPHVLKSNLAAVLEKICALFVDKDAVVRQAVIKLLRVMLPRVQEKHISSFFPVISAHLCCCMTHIYDDIQADSLQFLDVLLEFYPKLVVANSNQILPNFIEQISRVKSTDASSKTVTASTSARSLSVNPNSKTSSQRWRARVLERLFKLLTAVIDNEKGTTLAQNEPAANTTSKKLKWSEDVSKCFIQPVPNMFRDHALAKGFIIR